MFTDRFLQAFDAVVQQLGLSAYLCGGTVRDLLLNRPFRDVDVVLSSRVLEAAELFRTQINSPSFVLDHERQVARVVCPGGNWDLTAFRNHTIEGDLLKRDFTINALAVKWEDFYPNRTLDAVIDPASGRNDLDAKIIRSVSDDSMEDDPLRMLRAFRIHAELQFHIDASVHEQIEKRHSSIAQVAPERITEELDRLLLQPDSARTWEMIGASRLFDSAFPELQPMKGCEQGGYHHLDVWSHSVLALKNFESFVQTLSTLLPQHASFVQEYFSGVPGKLDRLRLLKWALLTHDMGKPQTRELKEPGRYRFHGHDHVGADLAQRLFKRLKFARKDAQLIGLMIEHHLRPLNLFNLEDRTRDHYYKFFRTVGTEAPGIILISYGDITAARGALAEEKRDQEFIRFVDDLLRFYREEFYPAVNTPELLKGRDLMAVLQMKPGPEMGELLREIREAQLTGAIRTRSEAIDFAKNRLKAK